MDDVKFGEKVIEGKTKVIYKLVDHPGQVLIQSKDRITAGDGARSHDLQGKAAISTATNGSIFDLLQKSGIKTHYIKQRNDTEFIAHECHMIPIEWVLRRVATGSFLRRNPGVKEGYRFCPPKLETFYKDDANNDPQWSVEQIMAAEIKGGDVVIGQDEIDIMSKMSVCIFEILEKAWVSQDCSLIDMKIEFGVSVETGEIMLADVIDSDSWRLWPSGDKRLMKDKQVYRELSEVTPDSLQEVKRNFQWVAERVKLLHKRKPSRVVVFMGSAVDMEHSEKIRKLCEFLDIHCELRVTSAHKSTDEALRILSQYEGSGVPTVIVAVAGRSNGLGPVLSANSTYPVINCPPVRADWGPQDIWSSLRMPSGVGCSTVMSPEAAGLQAAQILALSDHLTWAKLRAKQLNLWIDLKMSDKRTREQQ